MNKYQQIKVLGEGGFGKAILVRQRSNGNMYVIKEVRLTALSQRDRNEATKEAKVLASLKHPNIVDYVTSFQERGCFYIVMEYCDGGDLSKRIAAKGRTLFTEDEVLHYFIQVALAIKYIHDRKILHRDLKAQNIFLTKDGTCKLGDFGIARVLEHTFQLCRTQIGTPYYLSPEICEGKNYNSKTDIWSLGCILYELCTLKRAFDGCDQRGILMKIVRGQYTPISNKYSQDLRNLVDSMLTKDASKRPTINDILKRPFIQNRLQSMLDKTILDYEFSHTIIHGRKPFAAPTVVISKNNSENNIQNANEKDDHSKSPSSNIPMKDKDSNRSSSDLRLIDQNFIKEQQQKKQQQLQQQQQQRQKQPVQPQSNLPNYAGNVDPRYARRNYDIYGNARNPKQIEEQEKERQRQIDELKRKHQQDENDRRLREQKQQLYQQQLDNEREKRQKQREIDEYKKISAEREKQKYRLEQQKRELEEMRRLAAEQKRNEEEKRRASMEELRRQEEEYRLRREEAKRIMRNHAKEEERKQAEEIERQRLEEVERKRKEVEEMVKRRQQEADELRRQQEMKRAQRMLEQQREREQLERERRRIAEEEKERRKAVIQRQRQLREQQRMDLEERQRLAREEQRKEVEEQQQQQQQRRRRVLQEENQKVNRIDLQPVKGSFNQNKIRQDYSYNDQFDPLEQTMGESFIARISKDGPAWAKMPQKRIQLNLDDDDDEDDDNDEFNSCQSTEFFTASIKRNNETIIKDNSTPAWARSSSNSSSACDDPNELTSFVSDEKLELTFIDDKLVPSWARVKKGGPKRVVESFPETEADASSKPKRSPKAASRLLPESLISSSRLEGESEDDVFDEKAVEHEMKAKFMEEDDKRLSSLHDLAMSIKQALDMPDEKHEDDNNNEDNKSEQVFFMNDEQIRLPVANDTKSLSKRQDAIRGILEEKIGPETLIALNEELIQREADENAPTPIINDLPPGIVCLAQQWLMLDATSKEQK